MSKVLAVGGPKGGVGKTTVALNLAIAAVRLLRLRVLLVDADPNRSSLDAALAAGDLMPFDVTEGYDHDEIVRLHAGHSYDLVVIDLPGAREAGALAALLEGADPKRPGGRRKPAVDGLVLPTRPELMDVRPFIRVIRAEIIPLRLRYLVALVRVHPARMHAAERRQTELRDMGLKVADTITRSLVVHDDALELARPLLDMPGGKRSAARAAEREYCHLAAEAFELVGINAAPLREYQEGMIIDGHTEDA